MSAPSAVPPAPPAPAPAPVKKQNCLTKLWKNEKVRKIALEVLKGLAITLGGAIMGAMVAIPLGHPGIIVGCIVAGALVGGLTYLAIFGIKFAIQKLKYPANKFKRVDPTPKDNYFTDETRPKFKRTLEQFVREPWFIKWQNGRSEKAVEKYLWKRAQKGVCFGEVMDLLGRLHEHSKKDCGTLHRHISDDDVFKYQILEIIRSEVNDPTVEALRVKVDHATKVDSIQLKQSDIRNRKTFKATIESKLTELQQQHPNAVIGAYIRLEGNNRAHTIFGQFTNEPNSADCLRFYDPMKGTGFYDRFPSVDSFYENLSKHLGRYSRLRLRTYPTVNFHFYAVTKKEVTQS